MADATLEDYNELAGAVIGLALHPDHKIMPRPTWGQDAAFLGFVIDDLRDKVLAVEALHARIEVMGVPICETCRAPWPCPTLEVMRR